MRQVRALVLVFMVLGAAGWLMADSIPDPIIKLTIPGGHSADITCMVDGCSTDIGTIGEDGFSNADPTDPNFPGFGIHNATGMDITELIFHFQTDNIFQPFTASTTDFTTAHISVSGNDEGFGGTVNVDYFGIEAGGKPGSFFLPAPVCDAEVCPTEVGFTPGSNVTVQSFFSDPPTDPGCCDGFKNDEHAGLSLSRDVPEPGSLVLLLSAAGLLAIGRKFYSRPFVRYRGDGNEVN